MREIKCRAWDKEQKCMLELNEFLVEIDVDTGILHAYVDYEDSEQLKRYEVELLEYTGLEDKNGKEIYERDIVKHTKAGSRTELIGEVKISASQGVVIGNWPASFDLEIIGNICENPELLK